MYALRIKSFMIGHPEQRAQHIATDPGSARITCDAKAISAAGNFNIETAFYLAKMLIELAA